MNELKAQLIKNMQAELDELKEDLLKMPQQEILSKAYEYAMKTEIIYAAHDVDLDDNQLESLLKYHTPLSNVYNKYLKAVMLDALEFPFPISAFKGKALLAFEKGYHIGIFCSFNYIFFKMCHTATSVISLCLRYTFCSFQIPCRTSAKTTAAN